MRPSLSLLWIAMVVAAQAALELACVAEPPPKFDPELQGRPVSDWIKQLSDKNPLLREAAATALLDGLASEDVKVRGDVRSALRNSALGIMPVLIKGLDHTDAAVRDESAEILGSQGEYAARALPTLREKQKSAELPSRLVIAEAIARIVNKPGKERDEEFLSVMKEGCAAKDVIARTRAYAILGRVKNVKDARPLLEKGLSDDDLEIRVTSACALVVENSGLLPKEAVAIFEDVLTDPDKASLRGRILQVLRVAGPAVKDLAPCLADIVITDASVRGAATEALVALGPDAAAAVPRLAEGLKSSNLQRNLAAFRALRRMGPHAAKAVPALVEFYKRLEPDENDMKEDVVETLSAVSSPGDKDARAIAEELFKGNDTGLRLRAAELLWTVDHSQAKTVMPVLLKALEEKGTSPKVIPMLTRMGPDAKEAVAPLTEQLKQAPDDEMPAMLTILENFGSEARPAVPVMLARLKGNVVKPGGVPLAVPVRRAIEHIGIDPKTAAPVLVDLLDTNDLWIRTLVLDLLPRCGAEAKDAIPLLTKSLKEGKNSYDRVRCAEIMLQIDPEQSTTVTPVLMEMMHDKRSPPTAEAAGMLYGLNKDRDARQILLDGLENNKDPIRRLQTILAVGKLGPKGKSLAGTLAKCLESEKPLERVEAALALWRIDPKYQDDVPGLIAKSLKEPDLAARTRAATALGELGSEARSALPALQEARKDTDPSVRKAIEEAIGKIDPKKEENR